MFLAARSHDECEDVGSQLLGSVGYTPRSKPGEPETPPRYRPVERQLLQRAIRLLTEDGGAVSEALARQFNKCLSAPPAG